MLEVAISRELVPDCDLLGTLFEGNSNAGIDDILKDLSKYDWEWMSALIFFSIISDVCKSTTSFELYIRMCSVFVNFYIRLYPAPYMISGLEVITF